MGAPEWNGLRTLLPRLDGIFLVGLVILWAHRVRATLVRRMCLPILMVTGAVTAISIGIGYTSDAWMAGVAAAPVIMVTAAVVWGVRWQLAVAVGAEAVLLSLVAFLEPAWIPSGLADLASVVAWTFAGFQFTLLLLTGLINAARVLLWNPKSLSAPLWVWISGAVFSAMLVLEQMVNTQSYYLSPWASGEAVPLEDMGGLMGAYPTSVIMGIDLIILALGVAGIWALIRHRIEDRFVILLFAMGASCWSVAPFATWLPVWPLAFLVLWMWLRYSRPLLDKQLPPTETTVGSVIRADNADQIRAAAAMWGRVRNRGRALDRDLAKGTIPLDRYQEETKALLDMQLLPSGDVQTVSALRAASVSPVDVVLAVGPGTTPWENAKQGVKIAALVGVPAAVLKLWLWGRALPERPPSPLSSSLLKWAAMAIWEATLWLTAGAVLGLLWQKLPFRRGIGKALPLITAFSATELARAVPLETPGGNLTALVSIALFGAVMLVTALFMDLGALRSTDTWWSRRRDALAAAYGMENLATQVTFVAAQAAAVLTIVTLVQEGIVEKVSEEPARPPAVQTK